MEARAILEKHALAFSSTYGIKTAIIEDDTQLYCTLSAVPLPAGKFNMAVSDILFLADRQYPQSAMDMFWVDEELLLADGTVPSNADQFGNYAPTGKNWRRFSFHRGPGQPWDHTANGVEQQYLVVLKRWEQDK